ncbi:hypothetical protein GCM10009804_73600 [Kribbella hippodromi]|uniref:Uncharacterized protein n=1 Tax=Kribbella hippodromi TaxID=434347 RepID=A0ABN2EHD0_9ACTN
MKADPQAAPQRDQLSAAIDTILSLVIIPIRRHQPRQQSLAHDHAPPYSFADTTRRPPHG